MKLSYTKNHVMITEFSPKERHIAVNVLTGNELKKGIQLPKTLWVLREIMKYFPTLREDTELIKEGKALRNELENTINPSIKAIPGDKLRPYQRQDVERLKNMEVAGIFNEPRTGKSLTVLTTCKEAGLKKNCIVCPASLIYNWASEIEKFEIGTPFVVAGNLDKRKKIYEAYKVASEGFLIISYETLRSDISIVEAM